ncbi:subtype B tannase [Neisseria chenwenguii]|uniref:subtype B tannase n=1 Tax=Neisseria chenwenguii TaxID=1853278 RepID=UPI000F4EF00E|nr:subtype B tannase [Neisseria chenwenguii]ROV55925.1 alpha/beta hydrolase [Neisseria chenwenguii]
MNRPARFLLTASAAALCACAAPKTGKSYDLDFSKQKSTSQSIEANGQTVKFRAFEGIVYVARPTDTRYETINIYIPEAYYNGGSINGYTAETAPVFFPNKIGGYMPAEPGKPALEGKRGDPNGPKSPNAALLALSKGYVVASPGARGRTTTDGKAPAAIVDLKAAVRYLKANDKVMAGNAQKIISNGTSAGGALSALLGASGSSRDYEGRLKALGAAEADDSIFAVSAYCPITDLEHADMAYEWQFNGVNDYKKMNITMLDYNVKRELVPGTLTDAEKNLSDRLKPLYPAYLNSLKLKDAQGRALTLDSDGNGSFKRHIESLLVQSAQRRLDEGKDLGKPDWLTVKNGKAASADFRKYARAAGRQKTPPAFDGVDLSTGENQLFGSATDDKRHFTAFSARSSTFRNARSADAETVNLMNPLHYIGRSDVKIPQNWRIRAGTDDRDTSLAVSAVLAAKLQNNGYTVDYALPWGVGHGGDYDLDELFDWMKKISG